MTLESSLLRHELARKGTSGLLHGSYIPSLSVLFAQRKRITDGSHPRTIPTCSLSASTVDDTETFLRKKLVASQLRKYNVLMMGPVSSLGDTDRA